MGAVQVPPPNPDDPAGMAWIFSAGMVDPRAGKTLTHDRMPMLLIQGWAAQSKFYWDLGLRYHPELAIKHLRGGGQFQVADIVDGPPPEPEKEMTAEEAAERILDVIAQKNPQFAETIRDLRDNGTDEQRAEALKKLDSERAGFQALMTYLEGNNVVPD